MSYVYMFSDGSYSDYRERWLTHPKMMSKKGIREAIKEAYPVALALHKRLQKRQWDECERLFGQREWPYHGKFQGKRGTYKQFASWRDRYEFNLPDLVLRKAGFTYLEPHYREHFGDVWFDDALRNMAGIKPDWTDDNT